jgi:anaerobic magnesium-protoporphyrin IX monomethyl ester cyclase
MKVLLINPSYWAGDKIPLGFVNVATVPLGLGYLAGMLEARDVPVTILDMNKGGRTEKRLKDKISSYNPDIVGITSFTSNFRNAVRIAKTVKSMKPETLVVAGGVHATFMYRDILETIPEFDMVVRHEGEYTMCEIADAMESGGKITDILGVAFRDNNRVISMPERPKIQDLDTIPRPALHLLDPPVEKYLGNHEVKALPVLTTRGCPFNCIFCSTAALHGHQYRTRKNAKVVDEIEFLRDNYAVNHISFVDDNFTMQKDRIFDLCREMKDRDISVNWGCSTRVDLLSEDLLKTMKNAGCNDIFFGIESASQKVLDIVRKGFNINQAKAMIKLSEKMGIKTHCSFILGLPKETAKTLGFMAEFVRETRPSGRVLANVLDVLPGTELSDRKSDFFPKKRHIPGPDITKAQLDLLFSFYEVNAKTNELFRIVPPKINVLQ